MLWKHYQIAIALLYKVFIHVEAPHATNHCFYFIGKEIIAYDNGFLQICTVTLLTALRYHKDDYITKKICVYDTKQRQRVDAYAKPKV